MSNRSCQVGHLYTVVNVFLGCLHVLCQWCVLAFCWSGRLHFVVNVFKGCLHIFGQCPLGCLCFVRKCEELSTVSKDCVSSQMSPVKHCYYPCGVTLYILALDMP